MFDPIKPLSPWEEAVGNLQSVRHADSVMVLEFRHRTYSIDIDPDIDQEAIQKAEALVGNRVSVLNTDLATDRIRVTRLEC